MSHFNIVHYNPKSKNYESLACQNLLYKKVKKVDNFNDPSHNLKVREAGHL